MNPLHITSVAKESGLTTDQIQSVQNLLMEGATVPFIARYRKEATGSLDEVAVAYIRDRLNQLSELDNRREAILKSLAQHGHLNDELKEKVQAADTLSTLEDIYLPYRPKRRTRATVAREKGLEPLALATFEQNEADPDTLSANFINPEKGVTSVEEALEGARDIIAEYINEDAQARAAMRRLFTEEGIIQSRVAKGKEASGNKYEAYYEWQEPVGSAPSHRILAMRRGEQEDILNLTIAPPESTALALLNNLFIKGDHPASQQVRLAIHDSYKRLLSRAMETEIRLTTKQRADSEAIRVFADNLRHLLMAPPLGAKRVMGVDPGYRTGCKLVCLDRQGKLLDNQTIYPHSGEKQARQAAQIAIELCQKYRIEAVAVGNGTAGRETEAFFKSLPLDNAVAVIMVNESGASIYSASEIAREEFPDHDLTVRGAVSIGRRLMDPLSELVKIDPKSIGVGQYQHDVDPVELKKALDDVVISCVNAVGVDVNRASIQLLTYVSGLGPALAKNIVHHRDTHGAFRSREQLKGVPRLGPKAFEQCAGFLRVKNGEHPLDASAVHPESYAIVDHMADDLGCKVADLMKHDKLRRRIELTKYVDDTVGLPTLQDILEELSKPGRDPREVFETFAFSKDVQTMEDLQPGMRLPGIITNVTAFGAFVDIGVHQDGLVHVSELADRFVKNAAEVVKIQQKVVVRVLEVDLERRRISLSMRSKTDRVSKPGRPKKPKDASRTAPPAKHTPFNNPFADLLKPTS